MPLCKSPYNIDAFAWRQCDEPTNQTFAIFSSSSIYDIVQLFYCHGHSHSREWKRPKYELNSRLSSTNCRSRHKTKHEQWWVGSRYLISYHFTPIIICGYSVRYSLSRLVLCTLTVLAESLLEFSGATDNVYAKIRDNKTARSVTSYFLWETARGQMHCLRYRLQC